MRRRTAHLLLLIAALSSGCAGWKHIAGTEADAALTDAVQKVLADDTEANLVRVEVYTEDAVVYLDGNLQQYEQKMRAERLTKKVPGVKKVFNKIQVEP